MTNMHHFAQIDAAGICVAESTLHSHVEAQNLLPVDPEGGPYIGRQWDGQAWHDVPPPPPEPPTSCTPGQGVVALYALKGVTEADILAAIDAIPDAGERYAARTGFTRATEWRRDSATVAMMAQAFSLDEADLDALFTYAAGVQF